MHNIGFKKLPNELLVRIAKCLPQDGRLSFSQTDHRVRAVLRSVPDLWAEISTSEPLALIRMKLERSRQAPLHIELNFWWEPEYTAAYRARITDAIALCSEHSHRWYRVSFTGEGSFGDDGPSVFVPDLQSVKVLEIPRILDDQHFLDLEHARGRGFFFHRRWTPTQSFQSVTELTLAIDDIIPLSDPNNELFPALKHIRLDFTEPFRICREGLLSFMRGRASLQTLSISVSNNYARRHLSRERDSSYIELPQLTKLQMSFQDSGGSGDPHEAFCDLIRSFHIPTVERIELDWSEDLDEVFRYQMPSPNELFHCERMQRLRSFSISITPFPSSRELGEFLKELHQSVPSIEDITCRIPPQEFVNNIRFRSKSIRPPTEAYLDYLPHFEDFAESESIFKEAQRQMEGEDGRADFDDVRDSLPGVKFTLCPV